MVSKTKKPNHTCVICGKSYYACNDCDKLNSVGSWRKFTDCPEHYKIFQTLQLYVGKKILIGEARTYLEKCDLSDYESYENDGVKSLIKEIISYKEPEPTVPKRPVTRKPKNSETEN